MQTRRIGMLTLVSMIAIGSFSQTTAPVRNPLGASQEYGGIRTFLRTPYLTSLEKLDADFAVLGVPIDMSTSMRPGARYGPREIREASLAYSWPEEGFYYIDSGRTVLKGKRWVDLGDVDILPMDIPRTSENISMAVRGILAKKAFPVVIGGDHSITFPVARAYDLPAMTIVHFDAHLDSYGSGRPDTLNHATWIPQVAKLPGVKKFVQIGMRGIVNDPWGVKGATNVGSTVITAERIHREGVQSVASMIPKSENIYVTIDIDVIDPSLAPGTGTVEVGGLTFYELDELLKIVASRGKLVGMDVVEVNPYYDPTGVTAQTAARLIIDLLGFAFG